MLLLMNTCEGCHCNSTAAGFSYSTNVKFKLNKMSLIFWCHFHNTFTTANWLFCLNCVSNHVAVFHLQIASLRDVHLTKTRLIEVMVVSARVQGQYCSDVPEKVHVRECTTLIDIFFKNKLTTHKTYMHILEVTA